MATTNSSVTVPVSPILLQAPIYINLYIGLFIFITGTISSVGNFLVFTSRTFRARACSNYLIIESIATFFYFGYVCLTRVMQRGLQYPLYSRYAIVCKTRQWVSEYTHEVAFSLFALATVDRILSTHRSASYRAWSNRISLTYKLIPMVTIFWFVCTIHRLIFYTTSSGACNPTAGIYEKFDAYFEVMMSGVLPPILFTVLGILLLRNVRSISRRRIGPTGAPQAVIEKLSLIQQIDAQLSTMILLQAFVAVPSFLPFGAQNLYSSITVNWQKTPLYAAYEIIVIDLIRLFSYLFYSTSFYISCVSSRGFRRQVLHILRIKKMDNTNAVTVTAHSIQSRNADNQR